VRKQSWLAVLVVLAVPVVAGCQGKVLDPAGDSEVIDRNVDLVEAGVDYRTATTRFWVRFAPDAGPAAHVIWNVSTDGDTIPGYWVVSDGGRYIVNKFGEPAAICEGAEDLEPFDGTTDVTIPTSCIPSPSTGRPSGTVRINAESHAERYAQDFTGWTKLVVRS
jgi:hypothetical protein